MPPDNIYSNQVSTQPAGNKPAPKGHALRNLGIFFAIIFALALFAQIFNSHILNPLVLYLVNHTGFNRFIESLSGWLPWAILPIVISLLSKRRSSQKQKGIKMPHREIYFWSILISLISGLLIVIMATSAPQLGGHGNSLSLNPMVAQFLKSSYYVSAFIISMVWTLLGWFILMSIDTQFHKATKNPKEWSWQFIFIMVPLLSFMTILISTLLGISTYIAVLGVPIVYIVSRIGFLFRRSKLAKN